MAESPRPPGPGPVIIRATKAKVGKKQVLGEASLYYIVVNKERGKGTTKPGKKNGKPKTQGHEKAPTLKQKGYHSDLHDPQHSHPQH